MKENLRRHKVMNQKEMERIEKRIQKSLLVNISGEGFDEMGLTADISSQGLLLVTSNQIPSHKDLTILVAAGDELFNIAGEVRWMLVCSGELSGNTTNRLGVKIKSAPEKYLHFIQNLVDDRMGKKKPAGKGK